MQTRLWSMIESVTNIVVGLGLGLGLGLALIANHVILSNMGCALSTGQNATLAVIMTIISFLRSYGLRRIFNRIHFNGSANGK